LIEDKFLKDNNTRKLEEIMMKNAEVEKKEWLESAKFVEKLNKDRKKRELEQFKRQQRLKTYLDKQSNVQVVFT
jgi:hypothetical protein